MLKLPLLVTAFTVTMGVTAYAAAPPRTEDVVAKVSYAGVDFADPAQVKSFHGRLAHVAADVCDSGRPREIKIVASDRACAKASLNRAVAELDRPMLTAFHTGAPMTAPDRQLARR